MVDVIAYWLEMIQKIVASLFLYEIVEGVSYGWFLMACLVFAVFIQFCFSKIVK